MESHSLVESGDVRERREPQERIMDWKRSKAGHLGEMTKIFRRLDKVLKDYRFKSEVMELSRRSSKKGMSVQDREALDKLNSSVRLIDGHYEVGMLWKHESPWLPNNRMTAVARLHSLKRRLGADEH